MIAAAPFAESPEEILDAGLAKMPRNYRLRDSIKDVQSWYWRGRQILMQ
ncbi:MAG: hypothetical protein ABEI52_07195 [Halobacteriaceae archaeon]